MDIVLNWPVSFKRLLPAQPVLGLAQGVGGLDDWIAQKNVWMSNSR